MLHSVDNLCYQLIEGEVSLKPLRILEQQEIAWQGRRVTFSVLGASHAVQIRLNDRCLTELLTCAPLPASPHVLVCSGVDNYKIVGAISAAFAAGRNYGRIRWPNRSGVRRFGVRQS